MKSKLVTLRQFKDIVNSKTKGVLLFVLTPEIAEFLIGRNTSNRQVNKPTLERYVRDIKAGWKHNGDTIKISIDVILLDGQHRCLAVIETGISIEAAISYGLESEVFDTIDTGRARTTADVFYIAGIENNTRMAAMTKFVMNFKKGCYEFAARGYSRGKLSITNGDAREFCQANLNSMQESYYYGFNKDNKIVSGTILASLHYIFKEKNKFYADNFCKSLADGIGLAKDSPVYVLRNKLIQDSRLKRKMNIYEKVGIICKAWSYYIKNKKIKNLNYDTSSEEFPKI
jgi:hypothetical protein